MSVPSRAIGLLFAGAALAGGCEQSVGSDTPAVSRIEVDPAQVSVSAGRTTTLTARVFDADGADLGTVPVFWSSQNAQVATVNQAGVVTGVTAGSTQIAASLNGRSGVATVTVTSLPVAVVRVTPPEGDVTIGKTLQLTAEALDSDGGPLVARTPTWSSTNTSVATVNASGLVSALSAGSTTIRATVDGVQGSALVRVVPVAVARVTVTPNNASIPQGGALPLDAAVMDAQGNTLSGRLVMWSSSNPSVAVVDNTGRVQSVTPGSATITATCEGISATATITVTQVPAASVTIAPANPAIVVGTTATLSATVRDGQGNVLNGRTVAWSTSNAAVATVNGGGTVTAVSLGSATITAASGGAAGTTTVTVVAVPVATVTINPATGTVNVGGTLSLTAVAKDGQGNVLTGRTATWSTNAPGVATVSTAGVVTGVSAGAATITATIDGVIGIATISVNPVPVASVTVTPNNGSILPTATLPLTATARDAQGNTLSGVTIFWSSSNTSVATVAPSGVVTGVAPGTVTISATAPNAGTGGTSPSGTATVTVQSVTAATVAITLADTLWFTGSPSDTLQGSVVVTNSSGPPLPGKSVTLTSSQTSVGTVSPSSATTDAAGKVTFKLTGVATGSTTVTATSDGKNDTQVVRVVRPVASITLTPSPLAVAKGQNATVTATVRAANSSTLSGRACTIASASTTIATVSPSTRTTNSSGQFTFTVTGVNTGQTSVSVTCESVTQTLPVTVN